MPQPRGSTPLKAKLVVILLVSVGLYGFESRCLAQEPKERMTEGVPIKQEPSQVFTELSAVS